MSKIPYIVFTLNLFASPISLASPCPDLGIDFDTEEGQEKVEWIIEGTVVEIKKNGSFIDCEPMPHHCEYLDNPELITLENIKIIKGNINVSTDNKATISRKAYCFSGYLSYPKVNYKPALGKKMRFYGDNKFQFGFQPGYFYVEKY